MKMARRLAIVVLTLWCLAPVGLGAAGLQPPQPAAQEGFIPVEQFRAQEQIPGGPLVLIAYAIAWLVIMFYVWSVWRRLAKVEREIAAVAQRVEAGGRR